MSDIVTQELLDTQRELIEAQRDLIEALKAERNRQPAQLPAYTWAIPEYHPDFGGWPQDMRPQIICGGATGMTTAPTTAATPSAASLFMMKA